MTECNDKRCPIHGNISVRGNLFTGMVVSAKPSKTAIVQRTIVKYVPKYERYKKSKSRITAHNPGCINAQENDLVKVGETRKLSKTKSFVILEVTGKKKIVKAEEEGPRKKEKAGEDEEKSKQQERTEQKASEAKKEAEKQEKEGSEEETQKENRENEERKEEINQENEERKEEINQENEERKEEGNQE